VICRYDGKLLFYMAYSLRYDGGMMAKKAMSLKCKGNFSKV